jgi:hypothetical protein
MEADMPENATLAKAMIAAALIKREGCLPDLASLDATVSASDFDWQNVPELVTLRRVTNVLYKLLDLPETAQPVRVNKVKWG